MNQNDIFNPDVEPGAVYEQYRAGIPSAPGIDVIPAQNNLNASVPPTVNDDANSGFIVSSLWCDTAADEAYLCLDVTVGSAVWKQIT
jgi:hypothetical protein